ncbi:restriction endonuclease subunit S [Clostridium sp.]|uniref:restriction endonuclease subunit S n=1 Tax=Clostridium sp. TaxID=1506 RepID=UPI001B699140|nr:restriction endonuclease subunit S [Clostridium sp.]MBP3916961.1 restriction endonuclease subunit S [Clostridium sp.]
MKNVPKLRFSGFSDEWEEKKLGELLEFKNGINADKEAYGKGVKFINVLDILSNNYITAEKIVGRVDIDEDTLQKYGVNFGDVVFQRSSETREEVGTSNVYLDYETVTFGGFVIRGKKIGNYEPVFMNSLLKSSSARKEITTKSGGSTRYNVGQEILSAVGLRFPKLEEQEKIANFLTKVDKIIEKQEEKVSNLEQYKKGMMQKIFSQEIRFKKDDGEEYPEWEERKIKDVADVTTGSTPSTKVSENYGVGYMWASPVDLGNSKYIDKTKTQLSKIGFEKTRKLNSGSILVTCIGSTIGKIAIASTEMASNQQINAVYSISNNNEYIYYYLNYNFKNYLSYISFQAVPIINKSQFENFDIILPDIEEQDKIANFLSKIDTIVEKEKEKLEELRVWKRGLLQQMFI